MWSSLEKFLFLQILSLICGESQPEIGDFGSTIFSDKNICGFQITMQKSGFVSVVQGLCDAQSQFTDFPLGELTSPLEFVLKGFPFDILHRKPADLIRFTRIEGMDDVGVIQTGSISRFCDQIFKVGILVTVEEDFERNDFPE